MVRVYLRIMVPSLQKEFLGLVDVPSFLSKHDEDSEKMENLLNKLIYYTK